MELRHLRYFTAVAEELHFGKAADRLHIAQPPLSQQIQRLEAEIGVLLFRRTNRKVELTDAGRMLLAESRVILDRADLAIEWTRRAGAGEKGWLGIGLVPSVTYGYLPEILRQYRAVYPETELAFVELWGAEQTQALRERRIHVGFSRMPQPEEGIVIESIAREPLLAAVPLEHPLAQKEAIPFPELMEEPFIFYPPRNRSNYADYIIGFCEGAGFKPKETQWTGTLETALSLVAAEIGITLVAASLGGFQREGVVYRTIIEPTPTIEFAAVFRQDDPSPVLTRFLEITRETVAGFPHFATLIENVAAVGG
jgi:DNA-binding transcriptional LysR family regulator